MRKGPDGGFGGFFHRCYAVGKGREGMHGFVVGVEGGVLGSWGVVGLG